LKNLTIFKLEPTTPNMSQNIATRRNRNTIVDVSVSFSSSWPVSEAESLFSVFTGLPLFN